MGNAIAGGKGLNHAPAKHKVFLRVVPYNNPLCDDIFLDDYRTGLVDASDYYLLEKIVSGSEGGNNNDDFHLPTINQAAFLGRLIVERFATPNYESTKGANPRYAHYHNKGIERECDIMKEMLEIPNNSFKNTRREEFWEGSGRHADKCSRLFFYPKKEEKEDTHSIRVEVVCDAREDNKKKWNKVAGSTLLLHSYKGNQKGYATGHKKSFSSF